MEDPVARACLVPSFSEKYMIVADCVRLRPELGMVDSYFLISAINSCNVNKQALSLATGITRQRVSLSNIRTLKVPFPLLPEQKKISIILSSIQEARDKTQEVINSLKQLKKSLMKHLFTYGAVPVEEAEHVPLKETEVGLIPEGWEVVSLGEVGTHFQYGLSVRASESGKYPHCRLSSRRSENASY